MRTKQCIFDVNGVLIDSNLANAHAMAEAFTADPDLQRRIVSRYLQLTGVDRGSKIRIIQRELVGRPFRAGEFDLRWQRFKELGTRAMLSAPLLPGCPQVLADLGVRGILRIALSNTTLDQLTDLLVRRNLTPYLDLIRGGGDWPKAESLVHLLNEFSFAPEDCLFFGDGKGDLAAARAAGVPFVAIDRVGTEFAGEKGLIGPYRNIEEWATVALQMDSGQTLIPVGIK